jgi:hypothetical protein
MWTVYIQVTAFWNIMLCSLVEIDWRFRGAYCLHNQGPDCETTWCYIPEGCYLHSQRRWKTTSKVKWVPARKKLEWYKFNVRRPKQDEPWLERIWKLHKCHCMQPSSAARESGTVTIQTAEEHHNRPRNIVRSWVASYYLCNETSG